MKIYYAHNQGLYGTKQEQRDIDTLRSFGFEVLNPSSKEYQDHVAAMKLSGKSSDEIMDFFRMTVSKCDALAFRSLPNGTIPAGVYGEIEVAKQRGYPVIELPSFSIRKILTPDETRIYLSEIGQR